MKLSTFVRRQQHMFRECLGSGRIDDQVVEMRSDCAGAGNIRLLPEINRYDDEGVWTVPKCLQWLDDFGFS